MQFPLWYLQTQSAICLYFLQLEGFKRIPLLLWELMFGFLPYFLVSIHYEREELQSVQR